MPSMSGMLMSIRTTSGVRELARLMASLPDAAEPTTSMSLSKPSSFVRWSRVSGMSSTMRTRIWSAIRWVWLSFLVVVDAWSMEACGLWAPDGDGRGTSVVQRARCARVAAVRRGAPDDRSLALPCVGRMVSTSSGGRTP